MKIDLKISQFLILGYPSLLKNRQFRTLPARLYETEKSYYKRYHFHRHVKLYNTDMRECRNFNHEPESQTINKAKISIFLSLLRQVLLLIPTLLILPHFLGLNGVWLSTPVADSASSILTFIVLRRQVKTFKNQVL